MSDNRPIGVFDSGVGGLTVLLALQEALPHESTVYLGDLARCPYGPRRQAEVRGFALEVAEYLSRQNIKLLLVACNTATAAAVRDLRTLYGFPVIGVIEPGAEEAVRVSRTGCIGVLATDGTVESGAYRAAIERRLPTAHVVQRAASWLVPLIERGPVARDEIDERLSDSLSDFRVEGIDTLILGCTHFPLVRDLFDEHVGPEVLVVDSAGTSARHAARLLRSRRSDGLAHPFHRFLVTGNAQSFMATAESMFATSPPVETVDLKLALAGEAV